MRLVINLDSKIHGANMVPIWGRQDPGGPHVGPMNLTIWEVTTALHRETKQAVSFHIIPCAIKAI